MTKRTYDLTLTALDEEVATFSNPGVTAVSIPKSVWKDDGRPTTVQIDVWTGPRPAFEAVESGARASVNLPPRGRPIHDNPQA